jgi:HAE1 family hydrophobic/amphiphilic exporter-1
MRSRQSGAGLLALALAAAAAAQAQDPIDAPASPLPPRVGVAAGDPLPLTLREAVRRALEANNDVSVARLESEVARQNVRAAEGVFDPVFLPTLSYESTVTPNASVLGGAAEGRLEQKLITGGAQLAGRSPWAGGRFTADFTSTRNETSNQFARLNPQFPSSFGLTYLQPLLRGRGIDLERRQILLARRAADLTDAQLTRVLMDQLTLLEQAYWDLLFATRNLDVQTAAIAQAQAQVESNQRQAEAGTLAPIDVVEAATQVANFRQSAASAQQALTEAENRLKSLMLASRAEPEWGRALVPADLVDRAPPEVSLEEALRAGLSRRPELAELEAVRAQNEIDRRFYQDETRPQVDLLASYSLAGLAGATLPSVTDPLGGGTDAALLARLNELSRRAGLDPVVTPPPTGGGGVPSFLVGGVGQSLGNVFARRFPTALVQLQVAIPWKNTTAEANLARSRLVEGQIQRQRQQLEQQVEVEVRNAVQAVQSSQERLAAASSARANAQALYESERRRFESGLGTVFLVLERQTALVTAQAQELRARADLNQAIALLDRAMGATLDRHEVRLEPAAT